MSTARQLSLNLSAVGLTIHEEKLISALVDNYLDGYQRGYEDGLEAKNAKPEESDKNPKKIQTPSKDAKNFTWEKDFPDVNLGRQEKLSFYALNEFEYSQKLDRNALNEQEIRCYEMSLDYWRVTKERALQDGCPWPPIFEFIVD